MVSFLIVFFLSVTADILAIKWQEYRHRRKSMHGAIVAGLLYFREWVPLWIAITTLNVTILLAGNIGAMVGTWLGIEMEKRNDRKV